MRGIDRRRGAGWKVGLAVALACGALAGCSDDDGGGTVPSPTPAGQATSTRTPTTAGAPTHTATPVAGANTATPTATPDAANPTHTPGGGSGDQAAVEAFVSGVFGGIVAIADLAGGGSSSGALVAGSPGGSQLPPINLPPITTDCTESGTRTFSCSAGGSGALVKLVFASCRDAANGVDSFIDGTFDLDVPGSCLTAFPIALGTTFRATVDAALEATVDGETTAGDFDVVETITIRTDRGVEIAVDGEVTTDCVGTVGIETTETIVVAPDTTCPDQGELRLGLDGGPSRVRYAGGGAFEIDLGANGSVDDTFASCDDSSLEQCD